jgi:O-antigen ligase
MDLNIQKFRQKLHGSLLDQFIIILIAISPIFSFVVKSWINGCVLLLALLCTYSLIKQKNFIPDNQKNNPLILIAILVLASNFLFVLLAQLFHPKINFSSFDAPSRILICIPIFLFLLKNKGNVIELLKWSLPLTLLTTLLYLELNPNYHWGERFATKFVDPNALGSYIMCITGLTMLTTVHKRPSSFGDFLYWALWIFSLVAGSYIVIKAGTRGAFLATPIIVYTFIRSITLSKKLKFLIFLLITSLLFISYHSNSYFKNRSQEGFLEVKQWIDGTQTETSAGFRLSMFQISIEIFKHKPIAGYGEFGYEAALRRIKSIGEYSAETIQIMIDTGPHSTPFETVVNYGLFGLVGYLFLMLGPIIIFMRDKSIKKWQGLCFILSILVMGQSIHILTLKYTSSIFGLLLAILMSEALIKRINPSIK